MQEIIKTKFFLVLCLVIFVIFTTMLVVSEELSGYRYPLLKKQESIKGEIVHIFKYRSMPRVILENKSFTIMTSDNFVHGKSVSLVDFLRKGDFLEKKSGSDSLLVCRDTNCYYFVVGKLFR